MPDKFNFHVPDEIWRAVLPPHLQNRVVCLGCFDDFAKDKDVDYSTSLVSLFFAGDRADFEFQVALVSRCYEVIGMAKECRDMRELREEVARHYGRSVVQFSLALPMPRDDAAN